MEKISDIIIERAVELWCRKLHTPTFDNGDNSENGFMSMALATMNIQNDKAGIDDMPKRVEVFRETLVNSLKNKRDSEEYFPHWLDVDYGPCKDLGDAAEKAGIPGSQFSVKSSVSMRQDCVTTSFGYGAETVYHYPIEGGKWFIAKLSGSDIKKVIDMIVNGETVEFDIDDK